MSRPNKKGTVYLVGAGPGDLGLITVRGRELLGKADVVVYDHLVNPRLLDFAPRARRVYAGKRSDSHTLEQPEINRLLVREARAGRTVVRLKGGDPYIFGRGAEEAEALARARIPFEIVPGVTAAIGASTYAGIPLTHRERASQVTFVTGVTRKGELDAADLPRRGTLVVYMGHRTLGRLARKLIRLGWDPATPAATVSWATTPRQRTVRGTLATIAERAADLAAPSVTFIGRVVDLMPRLRWFENKPLFGRRVVVTRAREQSHELAHELEALGAEVVSFSTIRIRPVRVPPIRLRGRGFTHLAFTSRTAVDLFFRNLAGDARELAGLVVCAVGDQTARALRERGIRPDVVAAEFTSRALARELARRGVRGAHVFHPGADKMNPDFERLLEKSGARVTNLVLYRIDKVAPDNVSAVEGADWITFASAQTVRNFMAAVDGRPVRARVACIGPVTAREARRFGLKVRAVPRRFTFQALLEEIVKRS
ncbi:MAG TPA: uroporphyrinogen-III C-methyltransferase [Planctomycetota bacterium]|nr:uroporphyrinogen-III C-methyltransferase [Planctomycetota bacterium]